jgi:hypothetical protein
MVENVEYNLLERMHHWKPHQSTTTAILRSNYVILSVTLSSEQNDDASTATSSTSNTTNTVSSTVFQVRLVDRPLHQGEMIRCYIGKIPSLYAQPFNFLSLNIEEVLWLAKYLRWFIETKAKCFGMSREYPLRGLSIESSVASPNEKSSIRLIQKREECIGEILLTPEGMHLLDEALFSASVFYSIHKCPPAGLLENLANCAYSLLRYRENYVGELELRLWNTSAIRHIKPTSHAALELTIFKLSLLYGITEFADAYIEELVNRKGLNFVKPLHSHDSLLVKSTAYLLSIDNFLCG